MNARNAPAALIVQMQSTHCLPSFKFQMSMGIRVPFPVRFPSSSDIRPAFSMSCEGGGGTLIPLIKLDFITEGFWGEGHARQEKDKLKPEQNLVKIIRIGKVKRW